MEIGKNFLWTFGRTDGRTDTPEFQSTRLSVGDDLKKEEGKIKIGKVSKNKNTNKRHSHSAEINK